MKLYLQREKNNLDMFHGVYYFIDKRPSQTALIQVFPVTLLVLPRCLGPAHPENMLSICIIMSTIFCEAHSSCLGLAGVYCPVRTRLPGTEH